MKSKLCASEMRMQMSNKQNQHQIQNQIKRMEAEENSKHGNNSIIYIRQWTLCLLLCLFSCAQTHAKCRDDDEPPRHCEAICSSTSDAANPAAGNCTIRALVLLPDDDMYLASLRRVLPVLDFAAQELHARQLIPAHVHFEWLPQDTKCDVALAMIKAMDGISKQCAQVIFGPVCDYSLAAVSRITKYFNSQGTPLISVGGSTNDFEQKKTSCSDEFYMLLRTGMLSFETISELTINVMKRHNWSHSIFYYETDGQQSVAGKHTCFLMMKSLGKQMRNENMTFAQYPLAPNLTQAGRAEEMRREIGTKHATLLVSHFSTIACIQQIQQPKRIVCIDCCAFKAQGP